jgi:hypothetical protein
VQFSRTVLRYWRLNNRQVIRSWKANLGAEVEAHSHKRSPSNNPTPGPPGLPILRGQPAKKGIQLRGRTYLPIYSKSFLINYSPPKKPNKILVKHRWNSQNRASGKEEGLSSPLCLAKQPQNCCQWHPHGPLSCCRTTYRRSTKPDTSQLAVASYPCTSTAC